MRRKNVALTFSIIDPSDESIDHTTTMKWNGMEAPAILAMEKLLVEVLDKLNQFGQAQVKSLKSCED